MAKVKHAAKTTGAKVEGAVKTGARKTGNALKRLKPHRRPTQQRPGLARATKT
jgi:hypothetical protein